MKPFIFRNDDVSYKTEVGQFEEVHKLFKKYIVLHTIAVICKDIQKNKELIDYINANNIDVQVHCWEHYDFTQNHDKLRKDLPKAIAVIEKHFKHRPTVLYPPWNKSDAIVEQIAAENGLTVSNQKISLSQFIRFEGNTREDVINFHSWALPEIIILEDALKLYTKNR
jgi:peptidoglycan/xylan/chitin deacetylase (PgdA/CDA1 family)